MKYEATFTRSNGATFTIEAYATETLTPEAGLADAIMHMLKDGTVLSSVRAIPDDDRSDVDAVYEFVQDDWNDANYSDAPEQITVDDIAPYWDEMMKQCADNCRHVPLGLDPELYVVIWNSMCDIVDC